MKSICKTLSYIDLTLGTIGGIYLANIMGRVIDRDTLSFERSGILTFSIFIGGMFSTIILWTILNSLSQLLENQEKILEQLKPTENFKNVKPICGAPSEISNQASVSKTAKAVIVSEKPSRTPFTARISRIHRQYLGKIRHMDMPNLQTY